MFYFQLFLSLDKWILLSEIEVGTDDLQLAAQKESTLATLSKSDDTTQSAPKYKTTVPAKNPPNLQKDQGKEVKSKQGKSSNTGIGQEKTTLDESNDINDTENYKTDDKEAQAHEDEDQFVKVFHTDLNVLFTSHDLSFHL